MALLNLDYGKVMSYRGCRFKLKCGLLHPYQFVFSLCAYDITQAINDVKLIVTATYQDCPWRRSWHIHRNIKHGFLGRQVMLS